MSRDRYAIALNKPVPDAPPKTVLEDVKTGDPELTIYAEQTRRYVTDILQAQRVSVRELEKELESLEKQGILLPEEKE